jgi:error-prone DNA polymerase
VNKFRDKLIAGMIDNGYDAAFAEKTFKQLEGFGSYGFPDSHAASFALIAYASSWMKCHHPDVFCCAILNAQPMGFYDPSQLVPDARQHGVVVRPIDVNASGWDCTLEPLSDAPCAVRLGLRLTRGLAEKDGRRLAAVRAAMPFTSILELARRADLHPGALVRLAKAGAFGSLGVNRREASWTIKALRQDRLPLFQEADRREAAIRPETIEQEVELPPMTGGREVVEDYRAQGLTLRAHPLAFLRQELTRREIAPCSAIKAAHDGARISVSGLVLVRQKPGSAKGVMFITLEDETDIANLIVWPSLFDKLRRTILGAQMMVCRGKVQKASGVTHLIAEHLIDQTDLLHSIGGSNETFTLPAGRGDEARHPGGPDPRGAVPIKKVRDIYIPDLHIDTLSVKARNFR